MHLKTEIVTMRTIMAMKIHLKHNLYNAVRRTYDIFVSLMLQVLHYTSRFISSQIKTLLIKPNKPANHFNLQKVKILGNLNIFTSISVVPFQHQKGTQFMSLLLDELTHWFGVVTIPDKISATVCQQY